MRITRLSRLLMPLVVIVTLLGAVQAARLLGWWQTSGQALVDMDHVTPADLRGWMSLEQAADGLGLPLPELLQALGLPADTAPQTAFKDLEETIDVSAARERLTVYLGGEPTPAAPAEVTETPASTPTHAPGAGTGATPAPAGQLAPEEIKGRMSLQEVSEGTGMPLPALLESLHLPADTVPATTIRDLTSQIVGFEAETVQDAVAAWLAVR